MWGWLFLLGCLMALVAFLLSRRLGRPWRRLSSFIAIVAMALAVPAGIVAAFSAVMCSSEVVGQGRLSETGLAWSIERQGCGATTADFYSVRLGRYSLWRYTIFEADAFPVPRAVEKAESGTVRIVLDDTGDGARLDGLIVPVTALGRPGRVLSFNRGVQE